MSEPSSEVPATPRVMPPKVKAAIAIAAVFLGLQALSGIINAMRGEVWPMQAMFSAGMAALIVFGLVQGHRLAWQWGRVLGMFAGILVLLGATAAALTAEQINALAIGILVGAFIMGLGLIAMSQLLGKRSSREYFRLVCPKCGCGDVKAGDFFFNTAVCRECREIW